MDSVLAACNRVAVFLAMAATVIMMVLTTSDAVGRYLLNSPVRGAVEFTEEYLLVALVFFAVAYTYAEGALVRVVIFLRRVPSGAHTAVNYAAQIVTTVCTLILLVAAGNQMVQSAAEHSRTNSPWGYVLWPAYAVVTIGLALLSTHLLVDLTRVSTGRSALLKENPDE